MKIRLGPVSYTHLDVYKRQVNTLRRAVGQKELSGEEEACPAVDIPRSEADPDWIGGEPQFTLDGTAMLDRGEVPLARVNELLGKLEPGRYILLVTNFEPAPLFGAITRQNRRLFHKEDPDVEGQHLTFIQ